ncbi:DUF5667 domain-containing protein [Kitasatospora sp. YST-16]|uniref:DUF5667 domain-containing protein n=1 Tax=Kitasatospora TaxID=2063 RepID=UPI0022850F95|nr:DUF5667 domain-containing protein [Kitasatospora sp. YST-16]WAL72399.1 DUF5667 domain-containing protein [Kitasatospora sp. YST-16]WNW38448.1 DUF5667 domain-containing protein [Streptomyces sp. Li-HN-5-13]
MTANVLEHRRAKSFAEALEAHQSDQRSSGSHRAGSAAMTELLAMADALGAVPAPELAAETRTVQRARLMAAFEQEWAGGAPTAVLPAQRAPRTRRTRWGRRLAIGGLVAGVAVGGFAGAAAASTNALPGDALYGMKRGLEGLRLDWADSDTERGALLLQQASTRLDEAQSLLGRSDSPTSLSPTTVDQVRRALDDMHAEAIRGRDLLRAVYRTNGSLTPMRQLAGFAGEDQRWSALQSKLPSGLSAQAGKVDQLFDDISEDVAPLRLEQVPGQGGSGGSGSTAGGGASGGSSAGTGTEQQPLLPGTGASGGASGGRAPAAGPSVRVSPAPGAGTAGGLGDLLGGLTGTGASPAASGSPAASAAPTPAPSGSPSAPAGGAVPGITIPPLVPGLLPGLTLN